MDPTALPAVGSVDSRFQSYNIEMVEVTGGRFWKPYKDSTAAPPIAPASISFFVVRTAHNPSCP